MTSSAPCVKPGIVGAVALGVYLFDTRL